MDIEKIKGRLEFLREAEKLKDVLRSAYTASGRTESTAEHSWRLCLMAMVFADQLTSLDTLKILKMCIIHDLGEAINGDIPAISKALFPNKSEQERNDLLILTNSLDDTLKAEILALWDDYENVLSPEAKAVKALDKLETILQHNQGENPPDFNYEFNLTYGKKHTDGDPLFEMIRNILDKDTKAKIPVNIRPYQCTDFNSCVQIFDSNVPIFFAPEERFEFIEFLTNPPGPWLVLEEHGEIIACGGWANSRMTPNEVVLCWGMVKHDRHREGIGTRLMSARLTRIFENNKTAVVSLNTSQHSADFFARFGFQTVRWQKDGYASGIDLVEMKLSDESFPVN